MFLNRKAFTLVEMLVALAVSSIVIIAAYASYDMVKTQYEKNIGIADMHTSGRAVMRIIERDIRMAGYEHQDSSGNKIFSTGITSQLVLSESNNACCDGVSVIYDHPTDTTDGVERRRITYSVIEFPGEEEVDYELLDSDTTRYRLYKQIDIIGEDGVIFPTEEIGTEQVLADFVDDLQFVNITNIYNLYTGSNTGVIRAYNPATGEWGIQEINRNIGGTLIDANALAFGPDGLLYTGASIGGIIRIYNPATGEWGIQEINRNISGAVIGVSALAFGPDGLLYTGSNTGVIRAYNPATGEWGIQEINRNIGGTLIDANALAFGPDGLLYTGASIGGIIRIYNPATGEWGIQEINRNISGVVIGVSALAFKNNRTGKESLVNIKLTLRSKNKQHTKDKTYTKESDEEHHIGNYNFEFNDKYKRDVFFSTVAVRNMLL